MIRLFFILIFFINFLFSYGQNEQENNVWINEDSSKFVNMIKVLNNDKFLKDKTKLLKNIDFFEITEDRDLGFGIRRTVGFQIGGFNVISNLVILSSEDEIIQYKLYYEEKVSKSIESIFNNTPELIQLLSNSYVIRKQNSFYYNNDNSLKKFKNEVSKKLGQIDLKIDTLDLNLVKNFTILIDPISCIEFGISCGFGGEKPEGRKAIEYFSSSNNIKAIKEVLKGYNPEGRLYAVETLLNLAEDKKITLTKEDELTIQNILELNIPISNCLMCKGSYLSAKESLNMRSKSKN